MDKGSDILLSRLLKNWVKQQRPPENGRARLIWGAAHILRNNRNAASLLTRSHNKSYQAPDVNNWPQTLFAWIDVNSFRFALQARLS